MFESKICLSVLLLATLGACVANESPANESSVADTNCDPGWFYVKNEMIQEGTKYEGEAYTTDFCYPEDQLEAERVGSHEIIEAFRDVAIGFTNGKSTIKSLKKSLPIIFRSRDAKKKLKQTYVFGTDFSKTMQDFVGEIFVESKILREKYDENFITNNIKKFRKQINDFFNCVDELTKASPVGPHIKWNTAKCNGELLKGPATDIVAKFRVLGYGIAMGIAENTMNLVMRK
ncbi:hypothetical protein GZH46_00344 [Fragariocoptes setiger]|uniref:Uncharacterized protein n=1 Tax=Fragariocoptes setiger TaxID=1670756 RepID=A0ABQ7SCF4_9ACAR|nr:hypothetical protein GZH46_00344 [Fragariocoptes setiger]